MGYCGDAVIYDEQPVDFKQSWKQRMRWSRGYMQVFCKYGGKLLKGMFRKGYRMSCYDMAMNIMPAAVLTGVSLVANLSGAVIQFVSLGNLHTLGVSLLQLIFNLYFTLFAIGVITTVSEWRKIHCSTWKKIKYAFTFPLFMFTYVPICVASMFTDVKWQPIVHNRSMDLNQIRQNEHGIREKNIA